MDVKKESEPAAHSKRNKGGRPPKSAREKRVHKHEVYLSENEESALQKLMKATGKSAAASFRHALFDKGIRLAKARAVPGELMELLTDFKKKSSLIQLLAQRERDFNENEKAVLLGSSSSLRTAVERLQRHTFASLEQVDEFTTLQELIKDLGAISSLLEEKQPLDRTDYLRLLKIVQNLENWFREYHSYLTLS